MPYIERNDAGRITCLYGALAPEFQQARNYLSTDKLQERLEEYPAVHAEAARLGVSFDEAVADICARWPDWVDDLEEEPIAEPEIALQDIREAYEDSHSVDEGAGDVGTAVDPGADIGGDGGEHGEAPEDDPAGGDPDFSAEPVGADLEPEELHSYPGMMIAGDPLASAKAAALFRVDEERFKRIGQYDKESTETRLNELRGLAMGAREGSLPELSDAQNDEWQALESFMPWYTRIDGYAQDLRDNIRMAETVEAVLAVNISDGWPN